MNVTLHEGDSRDVLRTMKADGQFVHSVVTDPPYGLVSVTKRFGKKNAAPAKFGTDGAYARQSKGFMGKTWDGTMIERDPEFWKLVYEVMLPGAYIVAFSSSRTFHHMAMALELAGFITHPMIGWCFASGFPKAHNAARAIDKALGKKGSVIPSGDPVRRLRPGADQNRGGTWEKLEDREYQPGAYAPGAYAPGSPEAAEWQGWHYGGQVRKPALEPIYVGQKPFSTPSGAHNLLKHGVGAVNIDGVRVPAHGRPNRTADYKDTQSHVYAGRLDGSLSGGSKADGVTDLGRWPANLIHDGSAEVAALFPHSRSGKPGIKRKGNDGACYGAESRPPGTPMGGYGDEGSAARFFESYQYLCYECGDRGWTVEGYDAEAIQVSCQSCSGSCNDPPPFDGHPFIFHRKANKHDRAGSRHPTVKPIGLIRSLVRHVTPPGGTCLDMFAGTGTTGQAAQLEGMDVVLIERDPESARDIRNRLGLVDPDFADLLGGEEQSTGSGQFDELLGV